VPSTDRGLAFYSITSSARASRVGGISSAERPSGLEVDDEFVLCRRLYRQVGRLLALEDPIDIASGAAIRLDCVGPVSPPSVAKKR
jgi:hypothetical protein